MLNEVLFEKGGTSVMGEREPNDLHAVAHDLRSSLRAIAIYSDLLTVEVRRAQLDRTKIEQLCSSIGGAIEGHADQLDQLDQLAADEL